MADVDRLESVVTPGSTVYSPDSNQLGCSLRIPIGWAPVGWNSVGQVAPVRIPVDKLSRREDLLGPATGSNWGAGVLEDEYPIHRQR